MTKSPPLKWLLASALTLVCSASMAHDKGRYFSITQFHAFATITPDAPRLIATCKDQAGNTYTNVGVTGTGPITSTDPRLSGIFHADAMILTDQHGVGVSRDKWWITDPVTGKVKATGVAQALDTDQTAPIMAVNTARLADGSFVSHIAIVTLPSAATQGKLTIEYGGNVPADPGRGVIMSGIDCGGYFAANIDGYKKRGSAGHGHDDDDDDDDHGH